MKQTINVSDFRDAFRKMGRADNFSYEGLGILFDFFEELDEQMELDVIAICCEYAEETSDSIAESYSIDIDGLDDGEILDAVTRYLADHTTVVEITSARAIVYAQF